MKPRFKKRVEPWVKKPITVCKGCGEKVPTANFCMWCGGPILWKPIKEIKK